MAPTEICRQYDTHDRQHASEIDAIYAAHLYLYLLQLGIGVRVVLVMQQCIHDSTAILTKPKRN